MLRSAPADDGHRKHPVLRLDSHERYTPVPVEALLDAKAKLRPSGVALTGLDQLDTRATRIDMPPRPEQWAPAVQARYPPVGYLRRVPGGKLIWLQYWLFYLDNPKKYVGAGVHEGDWEFVQVGYAGPQPVCITGSQHHSGEARDWWEVELTVDGRPVVYVARDSHANYLQVTDGLEDQADGRGPLLEKVEWRPFGPWATWPGLWGNSTGEGRSPESPGCQGNRWSLPHLYHGAAHRAPR